MTLTQLNAFCLVARLGSVRAAAKTLGVSEPAVSQALATLRQHLGDPLVARAEGSMTLTPGGNRLLPLASQMVAMGAEAEAAVRAAQGHPEQVRVVASSALAEFVMGPLLNRFVQRTSRSVDISSGVASGREMAVLVANRLVDVALGPPLTGDVTLECQPIFRCRLVVVASPSLALRGRPADWRWLVDPAGTDQTSEVTQLLRRLGVPESHLRVFPNQTAAWAASIAGEGVAPAIAHLAARHLDREELRVVHIPGTQVETCWYATTLRPDRRLPATNTLRRFLATPEAMQLLRTPEAGVPPSRFRPPVYVTIWS
ncbi:MAG: LysR family transcriptional regulator [Candidatus Dormibacteraceae bacterium]